MTRAAAVLAVISAVLLSAPLDPCAAAGSDALPTTRAAHSSPTASLPATLDDPAIVHLLRRATFGLRPGDVDRVRALGADDWLERQLHPERIDDTATVQALADLRTLEMPIAQLLREFPRPDLAMLATIQSGDMTLRDLLRQYPPEKRPGRITAELQTAKMLRAVQSERQLQEVMVDFWFNHFNVFAGKGDVRWFVGAYERDAIRPHALGRFGDLVRATARHPAMLVYLDQWLSAKPDLTIPVGPSRGRKAGLNENYARELMELHTVGVDGGYTQKDVTEVARAFTGWTIDRRADSRFRYRPVMHDYGEKIVLGQRLAPGGGERDGERVIQILTRNGATARFIAGKLVRRFVADEPPAALVERVAATFTHTDGDVRAMLRTIFAAAEFWSAEARGVKIKKPFELVASAIRALGGGVDARGALSLARATGDIGEPLYEAQPPTGHPDSASAWVSTAALLGRMNFALDLVHGRYQGVRADLGRIAGGADPRQPVDVLDRLLTTLLPGGASTSTREALVEHLRDPQITRLSPDDRGVPSTDVPRLAALVLGAPEFQRR